MARYVSYLIDDVRTSTENEDFSDTIGIKDAEFLRFINDAQFRIHAKIIQKHPSVFLAEKTYSVVGGQEAYTIPRQAYMQNKITQVEYNSESSGNNYYYPLRPGALFERDTGSKGSPVKYIRKSGEFLLLPVPQSSTGQLRLTYVRRIPKLDLRRGSVATATLDSATSTITTLTLNVSTDTVDTTELDKWTRISIVDEEGNVKMSNIKVTDVDGSTGVVTVDSSFTYESGETIAVGNYVVAGDYSSTHSQLDEMVERYVIAYATFKILQRDSNITDLQVQQNILMEMEDEIIQSYSEMSDDIMEIPTIISEDDDWYGF